MIKKDKTYNTMKNSITCGIATGQFAGETCQTMNIDVMKINFEVCTLIFSHLTFG